MDNVLLGKIVKAMYKLSGKTLARLSDETGLTVDMINNLFYARLLKPGFTGVCQLVNATGYTVAELCGFAEIAASLPLDADITEEFTKYVSSVRDTVPTVSAAGQIAGTAETSVTGMLPGELSALNEACERQMEHYRAMQHDHTEHLQTVYREQMAKMEGSVQRLKEHYDHSVGEIKKAHAEEIARYERETASLRRANLIIACILGIIAAAAVVLLLLTRG